MAWKTVIERNNETFNKSQGIFQTTFEIDEATYTAISTGEGEGEEEINAARTIAGIYEAAAVARGYDPDKQRTVKLYANLKDGNLVVDSSLSSFAR